MLRFNCDMLQVVSFDHPTRRI